MTTTRSAALRPPRPVEPMTRVQKLAALLVILGPENAAPLLQGLDAAETRMVSTEMNGLPALTPELKTEILREFSEVAVQASTLSLEPPSKRAAAPPCPPVARPAESALRRINRVEPFQIFRALQHEQPQTIALLISLIEPKKASEVLACLPPEARSRVIERLAVLPPVSSEVIETLGEILLRNIGTRPGASCPEPANPKRTTASKPGRAPFFFRFNHKTSHRQMTYAFHG